VDRTSIGRSQTSAGHLPPAAPGFLLPPQVFSKLGFDLPRRTRPLTAVTRTATSPAPGKQSPSTAPSHQQHPRPAHLGPTAQGEGRRGNNKVVPHVPPQNRGAKQRAPTETPTTAPHRHESTQSPGKPGLCKRQLPCVSTTARRGGVRASVRRKGIRNIRFAYRLGWPASARPPTPAGEPFHLSQPGRLYLFFKFLRRTLARRRRNWCSCT